MLLITYAVKYIQSKYITRYYNTSKSMHVRIVNSIAWDVLKLGAIQYMLRCSVYSPPSQKSVVFHGK